MKRMALAVMITLLTFALSACACEHEWQDATCVDPQICSLCDEVQGEALDHKWRAATCVDPKTCRVCGETEGEATGHNWADATCVGPKTCSTCGAVDGDALGHNLGEWQVQETSYIDGVSVSIKSCIVCGEKVEKKEEPLETLHDGEKFLISPYDFHKRLMGEYLRINDDMFVRSGTNGDKFMCGFLLDGKQKGVLWFSDGETHITKGQKNDACFKKIQGTISEDIINAMTALVKTCDPSLSAKQANSVAYDILINGKKELNGIVYEGSSYNGGGQFWISVNG